MADVCVSLCAQQSLAGDGPAVPGLGSRSGAVPSPGAADPVLPFLPGTARPLGTLWGARCSWWPNHHPSSPQGAKRGRWGAPGTGLGSLALSKAPALGVPLSLCAATRAQGPGLRTMRAGQDSARCPRVPGALCHCSGGPGREESRGCATRVRCQGGGSRLSGRAGAVLSSPSAHRLLCPIFLIGSVLSFLSSPSLDGIFLVLPCR